MCPAWLLFSLGPCFFFFSFNMRFGFKSYNVHTGDIIGLLIVDSFLTPIVSFWASVSPRRMGFFFGLFLLMSAVANELLFMREIFGVDLEGLQTSANAQLMDHLSFSMVYLLMQWGLASSAVLGLSLGFHFSSGHPFFMCFLFFCRYLGVTIGALITLLGEHQVWKHVSCGVAVVVSAGFCLAAPYWDRTLSSNKLGLPRKGGTHTRVQSLLDQQDMECSTLCCEANKEELASHSTDVKKFPTVCVLNKQRSTSPNESSTRISLPCSFSGKTEPDLEKCERNLEGYQKRGREIGCLCVNKSWNNTRKSAFSFWSALRRTISARPLKYTIIAFGHFAIVDRVWLESWKYFADIVTRKLAQLSEKSSRSSYSPPWGISGFSALLGCASVGIGMMAVAIVATVRLNKIEKNIELKLKYLGMERREEQSKKGTKQALNSEKSPRAMQKWLSVNSSHMASLPRLPPLPEGTEEEVGTGSDGTQQFFQTELIYESAQRGFEEYPSDIGATRDLHSISLSLAAGPPPPIPREVPSVSSLASPRRLSAPLSEKRKPYVHLIRSLSRSSTFTASRGHLRKSKSAEGAAGGARFILSSVHEVEFRNSEKQESRFFTREKSSCAELIALHHMSWVQSSEHDSKAGRQSGPSGKEAAKAWCEHTETCVREAPRCGNKEMRHPMDSLPAEFLNGARPTREATDSQGPFGEFDCSHVSESLIVSEIAVFSTIPALFLLMCAWLFPLKTSDEERSLYLYYGVLAFPIQISSACLDFAIRLSCFSLGRRLGCSALPYALARGMERIVNLTCRVIMVKVGVFTSRHEVSTVPHRVLLMVVACALVVITVLLSIAHAVVRREVEEVVWHRQNRARQ